MARQTRRSGREKAQSRTVHAVAQTRRRRAVVEDVAEMAAAAAAMNFGAGHAEDLIDGGPTALSSGCQKLGQPVPLSNLVSDENSGRSQPAQAKVPAASRIERAGAGALGAMLAQHRVLRRG